MASQHLQIEFRIEPATERDVPVILRMIKGLAEYERLSQMVVATEAGLRSALFGPRPVAEVVIGYAGDEPAGFAVFFPNFSTFLGKPGLYLEDLFVEPRWRRRGLGRKLLKHVAGVAAARGCGRLEWAVLDWNEPRSGFTRIGAEPLDEWTVFRLTGMRSAALRGGTGTGMRDEIGGSNCSGFAVIRVYLCASVAEVSLLSLGVLAVGLLSAHASGGGQPQKKCVSPNT